MTQTPEMFDGPFARLLICLAALLLLIGCGPGSGQGLDEDGNPIIACWDLNENGIGDLPDEDTNGDGVVDVLDCQEGNPNATLAWLQLNVFGGVCSQCHTGAGAPLGVNWSSESESCNNVGRTSGEMPPLLIIESGNPAGSYVIWKVEDAGPNGEAIVGGQMPLANPPLTAETIQNLRDWITDGTPGCQTQQSTAFANSAATKSGVPGGSDPQGGATYPVGSWTHVWNETLQICATCHGLTPSNPRCLADLQCPPNGVVLGIDNYFGVVDGYTVAPFDPDGSNLWKRVTEDDPDRRMPFGLAPLTQTQLNIIRNWIADGARFCPEAEVCP